MKYIKEYNMESLQDFIAWKVNKFPIKGAESPLRDMVFRGHAKADEYKLLPSALRNEKNGRPVILKYHKCADAVYGRETTSSNDIIESEFCALSHFYKECNQQGLHIPSASIFQDDFFSPFHEGAFEEIDRWYTEGVREIAALAQHNGLPTRLLDWTFDINVAIYFALQGVVKNLKDRSKKEPEDGLLGKYAIWGVNPTYIAMLNNLAMLDGKSCPVHFFVPKYAENKNLYAQSGLLSYEEIQYTKAGGLPLYNPKTQDEILENYFDSYTKEVINLECDIPPMCKIEIPIGSARNVALEFEYICQKGYNAARLFPGYSGIIRKFEEDSWIEILKKC